MKPKGTYRIILMLIVCLGASLPLWGQGQDLIGKAKEPETASYSEFLRDTTHIESLIRLSKKIQTHYIDSSIALSKKALFLSIASGYNDGAANALLNLASLYSIYKQDLDQSRQYRQMAYVFCQGAAYYKGKLLVTYFVDRAAPYHVTGDYDSVAWYCHKALTIFNQYQLKDTVTLTRLYSNISTAYYSTSQPEKALYYLKKAEALLSSRKADEALIGIYTNLGFNYYGVKEYALAKSYSFKALAICHLFPDTRYKNALPLIYMVLGRSFLEENGPEAALPYFLSAISAGKKIPSYAGDAGNYNGIAAVYERLNKPAEQEKYLKLALASAQKTKAGGSTLITIYYDLAKLYGREKKYADAYYYRDLAASIKDSILDKERLTLSDKLDVSYRTAEKDKALIQKELLITQRNSELKEKNYWIAGISVGFVFLIFLLGSAYRSNKQRQKVQIEKMHSLQKEKEISNLKSVISGEERERTRLARELHDGIMVLFSAVKMKMRGLPHTQEGLSENKEFHEITQQFDHAIKELRRTAHNLMPDMLLEGGLAEAIFYFCKSLQQNQDLNIVFQQYGEIPRLQEEFELSIYRIVQELIQNVLKHAQATKAIVQLNYRDHLLYITVEDNGTGFNYSGIHQHTGMGLKSIRTRMRALNGIIDVRSNAEKGTTVYLEFDIRSVIKSKSVENAY